VLAFDADVLIYAANHTHPLGARVRRLFAAAAEGAPAGESVGIGSVLLLPELYSKPMRTGNERELAALHDLVTRLDLQPLDSGTALLAAALGATHGLRSADAVHLATAVRSGAEYFLTNNQRDFPRTISEIDVLYPDDLPVAPGAT
jgi:predicted nucleic acid-binding protein